MTKLVCADCRHENEPERIYCHNCGARLDRSAVLKEKVAQEDASVRSQKHLQRMFRPGRGRGKRILVTLCKIVVGALCLAAIIQMILPPDLPPQTKTSGFPPMINMDLVSAIETHRPPQLTYDQQQVNSYLAPIVRRNNGPGKEGYFPLRRISVSLEEGICRVNVERQLFGLSLYAGGAYHVSIDSGKIQSTSAGGYLGRMPIHPALMGALDILFHQTWETLARERQTVARLAGIEFHPQAVTLITAR